MRTTLSLLTLLCGWLTMFALGCGNGKGTPTAPDNESQLTPTGNLWGTYELTLDRAGNPAVAQINEHTGQIVVDPYVQVDLLATEFDPVTRIWDIQARFTNKTRFTAFGLWVAFHNLNGNRILDQDGFATGDNGGDFAGAPGAGQRKPVVALGKDQDRRRFIGGSSLEGHLRIQWPVGATNFNGLRFYLDASFPNARQQPIVENLTFDNNTISAMVIDWQNNTAPLNVRAFVPGSPLPVEFPMNDSGVAPDATAGDKIWTGVISPMAGGGRLVVRADDPGTYHFENELNFDVTEPCPDGTGPGSFRPFLDGQQSAVRDAQEAIASNRAEWEQLWGFHAPGSAAPQVNFDCFNVYAAFLGERPTTGFGILPALRLESSLLPELCYSTFSPGQACATEPALTAPFRMWLGPKLNAVAWHRDNRINECGTGNVPFQTLFHGTTPAAGILQIERLIDGEAGLDNLWGDLQVPGPVPCVDFATESVVVVTQGSREREGHVATITSVNADPAPAPGQPLNLIVVLWDAIAPGEGCETEPRINTPVHIGVVPRVPEAVFDRAERNAEPCNPGGCEPFEILLATDTRDGAEGFERLFNSPNTFVPFWLEHFTGAVPEVNFAQYSVVAVGLEQFNTLGHTLSIDCIQRVLTQDGPRLYVQYTHTAPGLNCVLPPATVRPTRVVLINKFNGEMVAFDRTDQQADPCEPPPACQDVELLIQNETNFKEGGYRELINSPAGWETFWNTAFPNVPRPGVNFEDNSVVVIGLQNRDLKVDLECVRLIPVGSGYQLEVIYDVTSPGANCPPFVNKYYVVGMVHKYSGEVRWVGREFTSPACEPPGCEDFTTVVDRQLSYKEGPYRLLINNRDAWEDFWAEAYPNEPPAPDVNFETRSIIAISPGAVSLSPHEINIDCITRLSPNQMIVEYTRIFPGANCGEPGLWRPLLVVSVEKFSGVVTYEERLLTGDPCEPPVECTEYRGLTDAAQAPQFEPGERVIRNIVDWEEYWNARYPGSQRPPVNFEEEMVIAINVGILDVTRKPRIDCVRFGPAGATNAIIVDWHREVYNEECPFEDGNWSIVVAIPRSTRAVEFNQLDDQLHHCE